MLSCLFWQRGEKERLNDFATEINETVEVHSPHKALGALTYAINSHNKIRHLEEYSVPLKIKSAFTTALVITWTIISSRRGEPAGILSIYTYIFLSVIFVYVLRLSVRKWPVFRSCEGFFHLINRQINGAALLHLAVLCLYAITVFNFSVNNFWGKQICVCMCPHFFFFLCFSKNLEMGRFICRI